MQQLATNESVNSAPQCQQYLTFTLGQEEYGLPILLVQEIKGYSLITPIPNTPAHVRGVMNLRGTVIPVVDLRLKFSMPEVEYNKFSVIIVVSVADKSIGLLVDAVSDVLDIPASEIRPTPNLGARTDTRFITGMAHVGEKLAVLLDIQKLLSDDEMVTLEQLSRAELAGQAAEGK